MSAAGWSPAQGETPTSPRNVQVVASYMEGIVDVRWDDPALDSSNTAFNVVGVNVYRAYNDRGPFHRVNAYPIGGNIYRDFTDNVLIQNEIVREPAWIACGQSPCAPRQGVISTQVPTEGFGKFGSYVFRTEFPIVKPLGGRKVFGNSFRDVWVTVNGQISLVDTVIGEQRSITLVNTPHFDVCTEQIIQPSLPTSFEDEVLVCYHTNKNEVKMNLDAKPVYRVATVTLDPNQPTGLIETPLNFCEPVHLAHIETQDYIWREAIRRNNWILQQGGERVKLFIKKCTGQPCPCTPVPRKTELYKQPRNSCEFCFGTGYVGGYDGPFEIIVSPDNEARKVAQRIHGRTVEHSRDVWTGPSPLMTTRDFIVTQANERYGIGEVTKPASRGRPLQQHFPMGRLENTDIRYRVPIDGTTELPWPETRGVAPVLQGGAWPVPPNPPGPFPVGPDKISPTATEKANIPDSREIRGRTRVFENITY